MSTRRLFYHGKRKDTQTPLSIKLYAQGMFFFALVVMFARALWNTHI